MHPPPGFDGCGTCGNVDSTGGNTCVALAPLHCSTCQYCPWLLPPRRALGESRDITCFSVCEAVASFTPARPGPLALQSVAIGILVESLRQFGDLIRTSFRWSQSEQVTLTSQRSYGSAMHQPLPHPAKWSLFLRVCAATCSPLSSSCLPEIRSILEAVALARPTELESLLQKDLALANHRTGGGLAL